MRSEQFAHRVQAAASWRLLVAKRTGSAGRRRKSERWVSGSERINAAPIGARRFEFDKENAERATSNVQWRMGYFNGCLAAQ